MKTLPNTQRQAKARRLVQLRLLSAVFHLPEHERGQVLELANNLEKQFTQP